MDNNKPNWNGDFSSPPQSYWIASTPKTNYPVLDHDTSVDVAVIGGGIVGITTAYLLKQEGFKVAIIEADHILQGTTGHTTAKITSQHGLIYHKIKKNMGEEKAKQYADANQNAIEFIEALINKKNIKCDFHRSPAFVYTQDNNYVNQIEEEYLAASQLGIKAAYQEDLSLPFDVKAAVKFENQARFHPRKYLLPLAEDIPGDDSFIFEQTRVINIEEGDPCTIITNRENKVKAKIVVIASHFPCYDGLGFYFMRLYPERSYALAVKIKEPFPEGMFITAEDPGRSLRLQDLNGEQLLIISGEHHKTGQGEDTSNHYRNLKTFTKDNFHTTDILYRWSTQDYTTPDEVPYTGHLTSRTPNLYVATGFGKWGMTNSTASALIIRDLIVKNESPWADVYNPSRFTPIASAKNFVMENANVVKELIGGKLAVLPENVKIEPGTAKTFELEGQKVGAYRDEKDALHFTDTTCAHMGCEVKWNSAEKSWDCPCHGSRYTYEGDIIEGPAIKSIKNDGEELP
jgi:glycine/D-amino acid oxidase-like deaminating enzyme/nitrite reductase/ring-hydroxylating ferredoxin subunit